MLLPLGMLVESVPGVERVLACEALMASPTLCLVTAAHVPQSKALPTSLTAELLATVYRVVVL